jgi:hypothetical protein
VIINSQELQRRIFCYTFINNFTSDYDVLVGPILLLVFHSYEHVSSNAWNIFERVVSNSVNDDSEEKLVSAPLRLFVNFIKARLLKKGELFIPKVLAEA